MRTYVRGTRKEPHAFDGTIFGLPAVRYAVVHGPIVAVNLE